MPSSISIYRNPFCFLFCFPSSSPTSAHHQVQSWMPVCRRFSSWAMFWPVAWWCRGQPDPGRENWNINNSQSEYEILNYGLTGPGGAAGGGHVGQGVLGFTSPIWLRAVDSLDTSHCLNTPLRFRNSTGAGREGAGPGQSNIKHFILDSSLKSQPILKVI